MDQAPKRPLEGIRVVEVAMWAFVPVAGGILADMGAEVIKVEPPTGDPLRGLQTDLGTGSGAGDGPAVDYSWESYNRGKRSITLDLKQAAGREALYRLVESADVFLTNLLPPARRKMGIDCETLRERNGQLIYAVGSAVGQQGPEGDKGGYDSISFWARGGIASTMTIDGADAPVTAPGPAFGDSLCGTMLAGGVAAAIAQRALTGEATTVDTSLLNGAMWSMQRLISQASATGIDRYPRPADRPPSNVLVNTYRTADDRWLSLCMLQADKYWAKLMTLAGRDDLATGERYATAKLRRENQDEILAELRVLFASRTLTEWIDVLSQQEGQWDVVRHVGELKDDVQVQANGFLQQVTTVSGAQIQVVGTPMQFGGRPLAAGPSPELGGDSESILADVGYDDEAILQLKIDGVVF